VETTAAACNTSGTTKEVKELPQAIRTADLPDRKCRSHIRESNTEQLDDTAYFHWHRIWKRRTVHPNLRIDYFHQIDSKEKAYWLGFLCADGFLSKSFKQATHIRLELKRDDEDIIDKFCRSLGLNKSKKEYRTHGPTKSVEIRVACKPMVLDLMRLGLIFRKSKIIEFPKLLNREMELAFLLGYFDGDGKQNSPEVISGSKRFLEQVKDRFGLPYKLRIEHNDGEICGRKIRGTEYRLWLGVDLFVEMQQNYPGSMMRKRGYGTRQEKTRLAK
jgi:hypothetical protein